MTCLSMYSTTLSYAFISTTTRDKVNAIEMNAYERVVSLNKIQVQTNLEEIPITQNRTTTYYIMMQASTYL